MKKEEKGSSKTLDIRPLGDRAIVKIDEGRSEKKTASGIIIPENVSEDRGAKKGKIVAVGEGRYEDGKIVPVKVKVGDSVLFQWGDEVKIEGETYNIVSESNILAVIK